MSQLTVKLRPEEFDRILIALNWYIDDREECATFEQRGLFDADADESRQAAREASKLLDKLRRLI